MSVNLLGNLMCPEYPAMYLVESEAIRSAENITELMPGVREAEKAGETGETGEAGEGGEMGRAEQAGETGLAGHAMRAISQLQPRVRPHSYPVERIVIEIQQEPTRSKHLFRGVVGKLAEVFEAQLKKEELFRLKNRFDRMLLGQDGPGKAMSIPLRALRISVLLYAVFIAPGAVPVAVIGVYHLFAQGQAHSFKEFGQCIGSLWASLQELL